jgi:uncharacterized protein
MSAERSRTVIDSLEFARTGQMLDGSLPVPGLTRLRDSLYENAGRVDFVVRGGHDARHRPTLNLEVSGLLHLKCQRCLGNLDYPLRLGIKLLLLANPPEATRDEPHEDEGDWIEPSAELDIGSLVEDEIILELPYAPRHPEGLCSASAGEAARRTVQAPFAQLAALKRKLN